MCLLAHSLSTRIDTSTLLWYSKTSLGRCAAAALQTWVFSVITAWLGTDFAIDDWLIKYRQSIPITSNKLIDWNSTLFTFVGLSSHLVWANDSSRSHSHCLLLYSAPIHFPFFVERNGNVTVFMPPTVHVLAWTMTSDVSVDLSLDQHTTYLERKASLSAFSTESLSRSKEGRGGYQTSPELLNKAFSMKSTQCMCRKHHKKLNGTLFSMYKWGTCICTLHVSS